MRSTLCSLGHSRSIRLWKEEPDGRNVSLSAFMLEFMQPRCFSKMRKKKTRQQPMSKEVVEEESLLKNTTSNLLTLQEWILSSPSSNRHSCSNRVHPSSEGNHVGFTEIPGGSFSIGELPSEVGDGDVEMEDSLSRRSLGGKTKKRVSFRLPEVADIFILDTPGLCSGRDF